MRHVYDNLSVASTLQVPWLQIFTYYPVDRSENVSTPIHVRSPNDWRCRAVCPKHAVSKLRDPANCLFCIGSASTLIKTRSGRPAQWSHDQSNRSIQPMESHVPCFTCCLESDNRSVNRFPTKLCHHAGLELSNVLRQSSLPVVKQIREKCGRHSYELLRFTTSYCMV